MPVFVEWRWKERTKSFLVIFHFYDDFSRENLRIKKYAEGNMLIYSPIKEAIMPDKAWISWAPSHLEIGLLSELLSYANRVNGLKENEKRWLKGILGAEVVLPREAGFREAIDVYGITSGIGEDKKTVVYYDVTSEEHFCVELCPEYIDYLKNVLKPYIS